MDDGKRPERSAVVRFGHARISWRYGAAKRSAAHPAADVAAMLRRNTHGFLRWILPLR